jgi:TRAP-type uncharacterized transport system fused permease subunit
MNWGAFWVGLILALIPHIVIAYVCGGIAAEKGYDASNWGWGYAFGGFAVLLLLIAKPDLMREERERIREDERHAELLQALQGLGVAGGTPIPGASPRREKLDESIPML